MPTPQRCLDKTACLQVLGLWFHRALGERALTHVLNSGLALSDVLTHGQPAFWEATRSAHPRSRPSLMACAKRGPTYWCEAGEHAMQTLSQYNARVVVLGDPDYPAQLAVCAQAPPVLSYRGDVMAMSRHMVAVVGTRRISQLGRSLCARLVEALGPHCEGVVSGGAVGVDTVAHQAAMAQGQPTVLVSGTGIDRAYPSSHAWLFDEVARQGVVVSQFPPGAGARKGQFPRRNETIAGLSLATLIVEAPTGSGALYTADAARKMGRPVLVAAGPALKETFSGGLELVTQGCATLVHDAASLVGQLGTGGDGVRVEEPPARAWSWPEHRVARAIMERLMRGPASREALLQVGTTSEVAAHLLALELEGFIQHGMDDAFMLDPALATSPAAENH